MIFMESYKISKYKRIIKLFNKKNYLDILTFDKKNQIFNIFNNNLIQKKSINFKKTCKGF